MQFCEFGYFDEGDIFIECDNYSDGIVKIPAASGKGIIKHIRCNEHAKLLTDNFKGATFEPWSRK
jgi:hypothetical protein